MCRTETQQVTALIVIDPWWQIRPIIDALTPKPKRRKKMQLSTNTQEAVKLVVGELVRMRRTFTGEDVHTRIHNKRVRRGQDLSGCTEGARDVSTFTRQLFNGKDAVFANYGSTLVAHQNGPVVYFALPFHAKKKAGRILDSLNGNSN